MRILTESEWETLCEAMKYIPMGAMWSNAQSILNSASIQTDKPERLVHLPVHLRDYFAAKAMQGILSNDSLIVDLQDEPPPVGDFVSTLERVSALAYQAADKMLIARAA